jgi:hypothetical protein
VTLGLLRRARNDASRFLDQAEFLGFLIRFSWVARLCENANAEQSNVRAISARLAASNRSRQTRILTYGEKDTTGKYSVEILHEITHKHRARRV